MYTFRNLKKRWIRFRVGRKNNLPANWLPDSFRFFDGIFFTVRSKLQLPSCVLELPGKAPCHTAHLRVGTKCHQHPYRLLQTQKRCIGWWKVMHSGSKETPASPEVSTLSSMAINVRNLPVTRSPLRRTLLWLKKGDVWGSAGKNCRVFQGCCVPSLRYTGVNLNMSKVSCKTSILCVI